MRNDVELVKAPETQGMQNFRGHDRQKRVLCQLYREGVTDTGDGPRLPIQPLQPGAADREGQYPSPRKSWRLDGLSQGRLSQLRPAYKIDL